MINRKAITVLIGLIGLVIVFETMQQLFYIRRFDLFGDDVQFLYLFKRQLYRWVIWVIMAVPLTFTARWHWGSQAGFAKKLLLSTLAISSVVIIDIILISLIAFPWGTDAFDLTAFSTEYLAFFTFQKAPLFTLGYIGVAWISSLYQANKELQVEVMTLKDLHLKDQALFTQLREKHQPQERILTVRTGNQYSVVGLEDIRYLEADDYCVNIYLASGRKHVMRISLKALEEKLPDYFLRVHRKYIVNCREVQHFRVDPPSLSLSAETYIPVSKSKLRQVKQQFAGEQIR